MFIADESPFSPATKADWLQQLQKDLKIENPADGLRWQTPDGFVVEPYYTAVEPSILVAHSHQEKPVVGEPPGLAALQKTVPGWLNAPEPTLTGEAKTDNATLRNALANGANALVLTVAKTTDLTRLLDGIKMSASPVFFRVENGSAATKLIASLKQIAPYQLKGGLLFDPVGSSRFSTEAELSETTRQTLDSPWFGTVCANGSVFHNAGATATQELAFVLGSLVEQYDTLTDNNLTISQLVPKTIVSISVGTSYFLEIAKLRALRVLLNRFLSAYLSSLRVGEPLPSAFIHCQTSAFYDETASPYTNLLRATTEAMSAVIGGCDALTVRPYDAKTGNISGQAADFSARIARNVSSLLSHEAYFSAVTDPAAGSYYIETITQQLTESAWALFLKVEHRGGLVKATESGFVTAEIDRSFRARQMAIATGKRVIVGVNKFQE